MEHDIEASGKHYMNDVPDELFDKAAQKAAHSHAVAHLATPRVETTPPQEAHETALCVATPCDELEAGGIEPPSRGTSTMASTYVAVWFDLE